MLKESIVLRGSFSVLPIRIVFPADGCVTITLTAAMGPMNWIVVSDCFVHAHPYVRMYANSHAIIYI